MEQVFTGDSKESRRIETIGGVVEVKPGDVVLVTASGATWSLKSGSTELSEEDVKSFTPDWILYKDSLAIQYGHIYIAHEMGEIEVFAQKIGYSTKNKVLLALDSICGAIVEKGEVILRNRLGWISNRATLILDPVKAGKIFVSKRYIEEYEYMKYRLSVSPDATYKDVLDLIYYHPHLQYYIAEKYGYVPPPPEPAYPSSGIMGSKGVTDKNTLRTYVNPVLYDFLAFIEAVEERGVEGTVYELVKTTIHELIHAARDSRGHASEVGVWFLGTPMGEEAVVEREAEKLARLILEDVKQPLSAFVRRVQEHMVGLNVDAALDLSILLDRLRRLGRNVWINTRDVTVTSVSDDEIGLVIGVVTGSPPPQVNGGLFEGLKSVKYIDSGDDRIHVELVFRTPSILDYESLREEEE